MQYKNKIDIKTHAIQQFQFYVLPPNRGFALAVMFMSLSVIKPMAFGKRFQNVIFQKKKKRIPKM